MEYTLESVSKLTLSEIVSKLNELENKKVNELSKGFTCEALTEFLNHQSKTIHDIILEHCVNLIDTDLKHNGFYDGGKSRYDEYEKQPDGTIKAFRWVRPAYYFSFGDYFDWQKKEHLEAVPLTDDQRASINISNYVCSSEFLEKIVSIYEKRGFEVSTVKKYSSLYIHLKEYKEYKKN